MSFQMHILIALVLIGTAPWMGCILAGLDGKITARLHNQYTPSLFQPVYNFIKFAGKKSAPGNRTQTACLAGYLLLNMLGLVLLVLRQDLVFLGFVILSSNICRIAAAWTADAPYTLAGIRREMIQMVIYGTILLFLAAGVRTLTGSFMISGIDTYGQPVLYSLPLLFLTVAVALGIIWGKLPFNLAASNNVHHGPADGWTMGFSGPQMAVLFLARWYETVLLLGLITLFFAKPFWAGCLLALLVYLVQILMDNVSARMTPGWMVSTVWVISLGAAVTNMVWLCLRG